MTYMPDYGSNNHHSRNRDERECCKLLDLLILTEMVIFCLIVHDQATISDQVIEPVESISLTEDLISKFENLVISEDTNTVN